MTSFAKALLFLCLVAVTAPAADQVVMNLNDSGPGSLRQAVADISAGETVTFAPILNAGLIQLSSPISISQSTTIDASDLPDGITLSGDVTGNGPTPDDGKIIQVQSAATITFDSLTFDGGLRAIDCNASSGTLVNCTFRNLREGAVFAGGDALAIERCVFDGNQIDKGHLNGGALYNSQAIILITNSEFRNNKAGDGEGLGNATNNSAGGRGGAIHQNDGTLTIDTYTFDNNEAGLGSGDGGAISAVNGSITIRNSTFHNNRAGVGGFASSTGRGGDGGALFFDFSVGTVKVTHSTFSGNRAGNGGVEPNQFGGDGGAIYLGSGSLTLESTTITGNAAGDGILGAASLGGSGGGIFILSNTAIAKLENSLIAGNERGVGESGGNPNNGTGPDIFTETFPITQRGVNLIGSNEGVTTIFPSPQTPGDPNAHGHLVGTLETPLDPRLGPLRDNGGPTLTHLPLIGSPAFNPPGGDESSSFSVDQRGLERIIAGVQDIGAVEAPNYIVITANLRAARRASLQRQITKISRKVKSAKRRKQLSKAKRLDKKLRKLRRALRRL
ncbi:MAG: choice-of-anchor Q domain-containing protein [Verrucomicrobiales bacterium]|nr:choice-of-anchor Q domain-containing protein [Verrucomicrobiales bacterium]